VSGNEWVVPGAKGAIVNHGGWHSRIVLPEVTVTKVGKRDITVEFEGHAGSVERKFRLSDLHEQGKDRYYGDLLVPADDPALERIHDEVAARQREVAAREAVDTFGRSRTKENALAAIEALRAFAEGEES
jgi:hypothetical protein